LRRAAGEALTSEEFLELEGIGWEGDLEDLRRDRVGGW
jgi:Arc/MetJ family transcription regulator